MNPVRDTELTQTQGRAFWVYILIGPLTGRITVILLKMLVSGTNMDTIYLQLNGDYIWICGNGKNFEGQGKD